MAIAIKAENLSKAYQLGEFSTGTLSRDIERWWYKLRGKEDPFLRIGETNDRTIKGHSDIVWSLKDINFEIKEGDAVGIIGRNGAGKSTLLKILSRVTSPTKGNVKVRGRIASLLEVGTGFHPELTGKENIYLNGAILGMKRHEIRRKFDEIVDFSGVERYIDTPVKRYSSGMYVRLAFAVAAHLESEILIVDEVLAVGDAEFQKKCLGKMVDATKTEGKTILFVSHNMASIQSLCSSAMLLREGVLSLPPQDTSFVINSYLSDFKKNTKTTSLLDRKDRTGVGNILVKSIELMDDHGNNKAQYLSGQPIKFMITIKNEYRIKDDKLDVTMPISKVGGPLITVLGNNYLNENIITNGCIEQTFSFFIRRLSLMSGEYVCNITVRRQGEIEDWIQEAFTFEVENGDYYNTGQIIPASHNSIFFDFELIRDWEFQEIIKVKTGI